MRDDLLFPDLLAAMLLVGSATKIAGDKLDIWLLLLGEDGMPIENR